jgi:hypothetical protein
MCKSEKVKEIIDIGGKNSRNDNSDGNQSDLEELNIRLSGNNDVYLKPKRKMLVFLNPIGGSGKALKMWNSVFLILRIAYLSILIYEKYLILNNKINYF